MKIGFIGYGNMASAIASGLIKYANINCNDINACARNYDKLLNNTSKLNINAYKTSKEVVNNSDMVILAVKPYQISEVIKEIKNELKDKIVVSIAAGIYFNDLEEMLEKNTAHISTIPNTPIIEGEGIMICEDIHSLSDEQYQVFYDIFSKIALIEMIDTKHFSIGGTIAGCTPAFTAMYLEALGDAGVKYGLTRDTSYRLVAKMLKGVGSLYLSQTKHPGVMKDAVCSPGGTTIKGVSSLEKNGFRGAIISAIDEIEG